MSEPGGSLPPATRRWLERELGVDIVEIEARFGDASHANHRVRAGEVDLLVRRFRDDERLADDPWYTPEDEIAALEALAGCDAPVPRLVAADPDAHTCERPTLVLTWMPGRPPGKVGDREAFVRALAEPLPAIHAGPLVPRRDEPDFVSDGTAAGDVRPPSWAFDRSVWDRAILIGAGPAPPSPERFIHRDYHQGNTLFEADRLTGIVDWTTGCRGPLGIDVAQMRMNLAWEFDLELADAFLAAWRRVADDPDEHDPYWEVLDALDWLGDGEPDEEVTPERLTRFEAYTARSLAELG